MKFTFTSAVKNGRFDPHVSDTIKQFLRQMEGRTVTIDVAEVMRGASSKARRYYFGVVVPAVVGIFAKHGTLIDQDGAHDYIMEHIGRFMVKSTTPDGRIISIRMSYSDLTAEQTKNLNQAVRAWAAQFGEDIPEPTEAPSD